MHPLTATVTRMLRALTLGAALPLGMTPALGQPATAFQDIDYRELVAAPERARASKEFRAFLLGIGSVIRADYLCSDQDQRILSDPDRMIDALLELSKTAMGSIYLQPVAGLGGLQYQRKSGSVTLALFTEHFRCQQLENKKHQLHLK